MAIEFNDEHLEAFQTMAQVTPWSTNNLPRVITSGFRASIEERSIAWLGEAPIDRQRLQSLLRIADENHIKESDRVWAILAWGGMRPANAQRLVPYVNLVADAFHEIRTAKTLGAEDIFNKWRDFTLSGKAPGLGPSFFTKLMYFGRPEQKLCILDRWTTLSINLLTKHPIIPQRSAHGYPSDRVTGRQYLDYLEHLDRLAEMLCLPSRMTDRVWVEWALFSPDTCWRRYLRKNYGMPDVGAKKHSIIRTK